MSDNPNLWVRLVSRLQGEVPADTLQAYRRASLPVFELLDRVEARRAQCAAEGLNAWTVPPATRAEFLCAWNAFVLQSLGNDLLDADFREDPPTAGYVPPMTAEQVLAFYEDVEEWLNRAQQAHANPAYRLDVPVPAPLPPWSAAQPPVPSHVRGVLYAMRSVADHAAAAMLFLTDHEPAGENERAQLDGIRQLYAAAQTRARYAADLHGGTASQQVLQSVLQYARHAIELYYHVGQLIADPWLIVAPANPSVSLAASPPQALARPAPASPVSAYAPAPPPAAPRGPPPAGPARQGEGNAPARPHPAPGDPAFDVWCLTDPDAARELARDPAAGGALRQMWDQDPDPARTLRIAQQIREAADRGDVEYAMKGARRVGYFHRCPWGPVYRAVRPVTLGGTRLQAGERFVLEVGVPRRGSKFRRGILVGRFTAAEGVEYGSR